VEPVKRDDLYTTVFVADKINALPGINNMAVGFALVALDFVVHEVGQCQNLHATSAIGPFKVGDHLCIHSLDELSEPLVVMKAWFKIAEVIEENTIDHPYGIWSLEHTHGGKVGSIICKGNTFSNFGQAIKPWITFTGSPLSPGDLSGKTVDPNWRGLPTPQSAQIAQSAPSTSAWQCPGCGTYYAYWVSKCECQKRNQLSFSNTTTVTGVLFDTKSGQEEST
jgi:hypothetical protein